ncbi:MAG: aminoacyl-tRNA hydrolase [Pseudomonadales bacterium]
MNAAIQLIVGLGNPGPDYANTRHNAGEWLVESLARQFGCNLQPESKFFGSTGRVTIAGNDVRLLVPSTFMNRSGQAIAAMATFYKIPVQSILVAHDELDLPPGTARLKTGGGHGGHNGLRDTIASMGNQKDFARLRIGIGHPGHADKVTGYVLGKCPSKERDIIEAAIDAAIDQMPAIVSGDHGQAMNQLHSFKA